MIICRKIYTISGVYKLFHICRPTFTARWLNTMNYYEMIVIGIVLENFLLLLKFVWFIIQLMTKLT